MLASLIAGLLSGETVQAARRARSAAIAYALAGVLVLFGVVFLLVAGYVALAAQIGWIWSGVAIGAGFILLAGIVLLVHRSQQRKRLEADAQRRKSELMAVATTSAIALLPTLAKGRSGLFVLLVPAAALAAYALYRQNEARKARRNRRPPV